MLSYCLYVHKIACLCAYLCISVPVLRRREKEKARIEKRHSYKCSKSVFFPLCVCVCCQCEPCSGIGALSSALQRQLIGNSGWALLTIPSEYAKRHRRKKEMEMKIMRTENKGITEKKNGWDRLRSQPDENETSSLSLGSSKRVRLQLLMWDLIWHHFTKQLGHIQTHAYRKTYKPAFTAYVQEKTYTHNRWNHCATWLVLTKSHPGTYGLCFFFFSISSIDT